MNQLTDVQRARIAENRAKALQRLEERKKRLAVEETSTTSTVQNFLSVPSKQNYNKNLGSSFFSKAPPNKKTPNVLPTVKVIEENISDANTNFIRPVYASVIKVTFLIVDKEYIKVNCYCIL